MNSLTQYRLVDENTDLKIASDYDPLLKETFEEYIQITEKTNPGKRRSFNNIPNQETTDIHVSGLVLNWSKDLSRSKLQAVTERGNIESLYLYADTIVINSHLRFPQTNVAIYARRLIIGEGAKIETTPTPFANPYAQGDGSPRNRTPDSKTNSGVSEQEDPDLWWVPFDDPYARDNPVPPDERPKYPTYRGADGEDAGDINLFVKTARYPKGEICFILNGSDGQHGEKGGLKDRVTSSDIPVSWEKVFDAVLDFAPVRGIQNAETNWAWAPGMKKELQNGDVYYARVGITHPDRIGEKSKIVTFGDGKIESQDNGLDAYASGDGGNGGKGGMLRVINPSLLPQYQNKGGNPGNSEKIDGAPKGKDSTKLRKIYSVCSYRVSNAEMIAGIVFGAKELKSRDGYAAKGKDGVRGKDGGLELLAGQAAQWLHPYLLKTVVQYAKDAWLAGDRRPGKWLLTKYREAFRAYDNQQAGEGGAAI
jgi:hypothetical protein